MQNNFYKFQDWFKDKKVLIAGGMGFIGSNLTNRLLSYGSNVTVVDSNCGANRTPAFAKSPNHHKIQIIEGDLTDMDLVQIILNTKFDFIFQCAGSSTVEQGLQTPYTTFFNNNNTTLTILEGIRARQDTHVGFFLFSTDKVYGEIEEPKEADEQAILNPSGIYESSKVSQELIAKSYRDCFGLNVTIFRMCNIYGPYDSHTDSRIIPKTFYRIYNQLPPELYKSSECHSREFLFIQDLINAVLLTVQDTRNWGDVYNISGNYFISIPEMLRLIIRSVLETEKINGDKTLLLVQLQDYLSGLKSQPIRTDSKNTVICRTKLNNTKLRERTNFIPQTPIEAGLNITALYYRNLVYKPATG